MRTVRCSGRVSCHPCPPPHTHTPAMHVPPAPPSIMHTPLCHTCPPSPCMSPSPCMPLHHARPPPPSDRKNDTWYTLVKKLPFRNYCCGWLIQYLKMWQCRWPYRCSGSVRKVTQSTHRKVILRLWDQMYQFRVCTFWLDLGSRWNRFSSVLLLMFFRWRTCLCTPVCGLTVWYLGLFHMAGPPETKENSYSVSSVKVCLHVTDFSPFNAAPFNGPFYY